MKDLQNATANTRVLVVEDNPIDLRLLRYALEQKGNWRTELSIADDGEKAVAMLSSEDALPDFVILDLNLPKLDGTEVLQWIRSGQTTRDLPVAVLSSSPMDVIRRKVAGASVEADGYFMKPMDVESFIQLAKALEDCYRSTQRNE